MSTDLYNAKTSAPAPGAPLIFAFHGTGGDGAQMAELARALRTGAGVVAPDGDVMEQGARRFFRRTGEGVYDMADLATRTAAMVRFIEAHKATHPGHPVYGFGYSNGANILASVMMARASLFDRVALLHPLVPWNPDPVPGLAGRPVLVTAGRHDPITPLISTTRLIQWLSAQGANLTTELHDGGHELRQSELVALQNFVNT